MALASLDFGGALMETEYSNEAGDGANKYRSSGHDLPIDLVLHILRSLPLRPLFRCTAVCKAWRELVQLAHSQRDDHQVLSSDFALLVLQRPIPPNNSRYLLLSEGHNHVHLREHHHDPKLVVYDACNGFWLLHEFNTMLKFCVGNPLTSKSVELPLLLCSIRSPSPYTSMLAFDPRVSPDYKVMVMYDDANRGRWKMNGEKLFDCVYVFSSKTGTWSGSLGLVLKAPPNVSVLMPNNSSASERTVCVNGYAYRQASCASSERFTAVWSFDIDKLEQFEYIGYPPRRAHVKARDEYTNIALAAAEGFLQYVHCDCRNTSIWKLDDHESRHWTWRHKIIMLDVFWPDRHWNKLFPPREDCFLALHGNEEVLYFITKEGSLCCFGIKDYKTRCLGSVKHLLPLTIITDRRSPPSAPVLVPFMCCVVDPSGFKKRLAATKKY